MSEETEQIEIKHTGGVGWFFSALIPGAIAGAALMWLAFYTGVVDWQKAQRIEARQDARVGVHGEIKTPVDLIIRDGGCLHVSRAFLDGSTLTAYLTNGCPEDLDYWEIHWNEISPDHTIIHTGYTNHTGDTGSTGIQSGATLEVPFDLSGDQDSRTAQIVVWSKRGL